MHETDGMTPWDITAVRTLDAATDTTQEHTLACPLNGGQGLEVKVHGTDGMTHGILQQFAHVCSSDSRNQIGADTETLTCTHVKAFGL